MDDRQCRICFDPANEDSLVSPCRCRGTQAYIHANCLQSYFQHYPDGICRVCRAYMRRIHPEELLYGIGVGIWCLVLAYANTLPPENRFMYLLLAAGVLVYYFVLQSMPILMGLIVMALSSAMLFLPFVTAFQLTVIMFLSFTVAALCLYIPLRFLMMAMAIVLTAVYSFALLMYALTNTTPLIVSLFVCGIAYIWYIVIRVRPPLGNL